MNFSQSYNLRKPLSLLLATALTATLLSGCSLKTVFVFRSASPINHAFVGEIMFIDAKESAF